MKKLGPGVLIAAAFIGPGTVTTASQAGANFGFQLIWALVFSVVATIIFQSMSAKVGVVTGKDLGSVMRSSITHPTLRFLTVTLLFCALGIGNAAYQGGNITGAALGLNDAMGGPRELWAIVIGGLAAALLYFGRYQAIQQTLTVLVLLMSITFLLTAVSQPIQLGALIDGLVPRIPNGADLLVIGLIGTTVVPYNLFLHASLINQTQSDTLTVEEQIHYHNRDTIASVGIGGLITLAIISTSATAFFYANQTFDSQSISQQLKPLLGDFSGIVFALGLFAAGMTSAITAPLATAYALAGVLGWPTSLNDRKFRIIWMSIIVIGCAIAISGVRPLTAILLAQATNGLLLPLIAIFLLVTMNKRVLLGSYINSTKENVVAALVVIVVILLGGYKVVSLLI